MRNVLRSTDECMHFWANQVQPSGKASSVRFAGPTLYSYAEAIARILPDGTVLHTTQSWSVTTSSHQSGARRATNYRNGINVWRVQDTAKDNMEHARKNIARMLNEADEAVLVVRKDGKTTVNAQKKADGLRASALRLAQQYNCYLDAMRRNNLDGDEAMIDVNSLGDLQVSLRRHEEEQDRLAKERQAKHLADNAARALELQEDLVKWRAGESYRTRLYELPAALRLKERLDGTFVETSHGAEIPVDDAIALWPVIVAVQERGEPLYLKRKIGHYTLEVIRGDGSIKVGCHDIAFMEIEAIAKQLELLEVA